VALRAVCLVIIGLHAKHFDKFILLTAGWVSCRFEAVLPDLLGSILASLDARALCTARLVSRQFRIEASNHLHTAHLSAKYLRSLPNIDFNTCPAIKHVAVSGIDEDDFDLLAQSGVCDVVTHLSLVPPFLRRRAVPPLVMPAPDQPMLPHLPALISLTVSGKDFRHVTYVSAALQELVLQDGDIIQDAGILTRLTQLTSLAICSKYWGGAPLKGLTALNLSALQHLEIPCSGTSLMAFTGLTLLTHLSWTCLDRGEPPGSYDLALFTRLTKLVHLGIAPWWLWVGRQQCRSIGNLTTLRSLTLNVRGDSLFPELLAPLSSHTALVLNCGFMDVCNLQGMSVGGLQFLVLHPCPLNPEIVSVLQHATALTRLYFTCRKGSLNKEEAYLGSALSCMPRLQSLHLDRVPGRGKSCFEAIGLLTGLTSLIWEGAIVTDADVAACAGLRKLRELSLVPRSEAPLIRFETFCAIAELVELSKLRLGVFMRIPTTYCSDDIMAVLNAEKHSRGWPPLDLYLCFRPSEA
jgi:hypothetical protein